MRPAGGSRIATTAAALAAVVGADNAASGCCTSAATAPFSSIADVLSCCSTRYSGNGTRGGTGTAGDGGDDGVHNKHGACSPSVPSLLPEEVLVAVAVLFGTGGAADDSSGNDASVLMS